MKITYEVFSPLSGVPVYSVRYQWVARLLAWWYNLDYGPDGIGWLYTIDAYSEEISV